MMSDIQYANAAIRNSQFDMNRVKGFLFPVFQGQKRHEIWQRGCDISYRAQGIEIWQ